MKTCFLFLLSFPVLIACGPGNGHANPQGAPDLLGHVADTTVALRFAPPEGCIRQKADTNSFAFYLRQLPVRPAGTPVYLHTGALKYGQDLHAAVLDIDVGNNNLQQCADAVMRLRAEYLFKEKRYGDIHFNFTNGFRADYTRWRQGERIRVQGNRAEWVPGAGPDTTYKVFRKYLEQVFTYAGTYSLQQELVPVPLEDDIRPGDVFIQGGFPGHAVLVVDTAVDTLTGARLMLLAQSYMPAQDIHILKNPNDEVLSPWYAVSAIGEQLITPEWTFLRSDLRRFKN